MKPGVANEIISHLQGQWAFYNQMGMKDKAVRIGQLADELRVASGQVVQNKYLTITLKIRGIPLSIKRANQT
ncbi:hypothetical protein C2W64_01432 [Brevibacillus laterosporus]|nr:hypothetical protein C2W64_01432 [Brevibacillus laterosporus]